MNAQESHVPMVTSGPPEAERHRNVWRERKLIASQIFIGEKQVQNKCNYPDSVLHLGPTVLHINKTGNIYHSTVHTPHCCLLKLHKSLWICSWNGCLWQANIHMQLWLLLLYVRSTLVMHYWLFKWWWLFSSGLASRVFWEKKGSTDVFQ